MSIWPKKKPKVRPGILRADGTTGLSAECRGGFSFGGHRLSSLYRGSIKHGVWLRKDDPSASSLQKYLKETSAGTSPVRRMT
jgi:hypothetical protein